MLNQSLSQRFNLEQQGLRLLLIIGPPLLVLLISFTLSLTQSFIVLGGIAALAGFWVLLRWPSLGTAALVASSIIVPFSLSTGTKTNIHLPVLIIPALIGLWVFDKVARERRIHFDRSRASLAAVGLGVTAALAFTLGQLPWFPLAPAPLTAQLGGVAIFLLSAGIFLLAAYRIGGRQWLQRLTWLYLFLGTLRLIVALAPVRTPLRALFQTDIGSLFLTWMIALAFSQALFNRRLHVIWRIALGLVVFLVFFLTVFRLRSWASGWMPGLVAIVVIIFVWRPRLGLLLGLIVGGGTLFFIQEIIGQVVVQDNFYSVSTRLAAWGVLADLIKVNPLLGLGPANYYWYTPLYSILGYYVQFNSHNQYIDVIAQTGLLGMACFIVWAVAVARLGWRLRQKAAAGFEQAYVYGALGGLAGMLFAGMLGDWILPFVYNVGMRGFSTSMMGWFFLGGLVALERIYRKEAVSTTAVVDNER
jgi:O-antigen ligase